MKTIAIASLLISTTPTPKEAPLQPSGKWTVDYRDASCVLSHDYGVGADLVTVALTPSPLGVDIDLTTIKPGAPKERYRRVRGRLLLQPSDRVVDTTSIEIYGVQVKGRDSTAMTLTADKDLASELQSSTSFVIEASGGERQAFAPKGLKAAFDALNTCQNALMKKWGYDPRERDTMKTAPQRVAVANWFSADDYPADALAKGLGGVTIVMYLVGLDGKVTDCRTVASSGTKSLDDAACRAITKRARYIPATGSDDKPMALHQTHRAVWRVPQ